MRGPSPLAACTSSAAQRANEQFSHPARRQQIVDFQADVLVVIGDDRLHSQLEQFAKSQQQRQPIVVKLSKSGGVITRSVTSRMIGQSGRVREYFYGTNNELCPSSNVLDLSAVQARLARLLRLR